MSTTTDIFAIPEVRAQYHRLSVEHYHRLAEQGLIAEKTELIRGLVIDKMSQSPLHCFLVQVLMRWLSAELGDGWLVRLGHPITTSDSEPEPDVAVVKGRADDYLQSHPTSAALVAEIAVSSERLDREKASIYAEAGVEEYWIVFAERDYVQVHRKPDDGQYNEVTILKPGDMLRPVSLPSLELPIDQLFPEKSK